MVAIGTVIIQIIKNTRLDTAKCFRGALLQVKVKMTVRRSLVNSRLTIASYSTPTVNSFLLHSYISLILFPGTRVAIAIIRKITGPQNKQHRKCLIEFFC